MTSRTQKVRAFDSKRNLHSTARKMKVIGMWTDNFSSAMKMTVFPVGDQYILNKCEAGYQLNAMGWMWTGRLGKLGEVRYSKEDMNNQLA